MDVATSRVDVTAPVSAVGRTGESAPAESWKTRLSRVSPQIWAMVLLAVAVVGGGALRIVGATFGFPLFVHPDEGVIVNGAMDLSARRSFEPQALFRPDHLEIKLNYLADVLYAKVRFGVWPHSVFEAHPRDFYVVARLITAAFGVGCIVLAYLIGKRFAPMVGGIAAVLFALFPGYVLHSHYATPDIPQTFMTLLVVLFCMQYLAKPRPVTVAWAGAAVGAGITIKYPALTTGIMVALVIVVAAVRMRRWLPVLGHGAVAAGAMIGTAFAISPVLFTNYEGVRTAIEHEARPTHLGADGLGWGGNAWFYLDSFLRYAGVIVGIAAVVGVVWSVRRRCLASIPLWTGAIVWVLLSVVSLHWERWGMPMHVTPLLFGALGIYTGFSALWGQLPRGSRFARTGIRTVLVAVTTIALASNLAGAVAVDYALTAGDTRVAAKQYADSVGATRENSISEGYGPFDPRAAVTVFDQFVVRDGDLYLSDRARLDNPRYLIISDGMRSRYLADPRYVDEQAFYEAVADNLPLVRAFLPTANDPTEPGSGSWYEVANIGQQVGYMAQIADGGLTGPEIYIYDASSLQRDPQLGG